MPFPRLVRAVDRWAGETGVDVVAQTGDPDYQPSSIRAVPWLRPDAYREHLVRAQAVIGHAGMGTILASLELGKPLLVMPRRGPLGETRNDHQVATARRFAERGWVLVAYDAEEFPARAAELRGRGQRPPLPPRASESLLRRLREFALAGVEG